jgi:hypothetical protein
MKHLKYLGYGSACWCLFLLCACSKMNASYYDFIKDGPITYPGKADSVKALAGKGRVMLRWLLTSDQTVTGCKVFWNFGADSMNIPVNKTTGTDTVGVYINSLNEGSYNFIVYTYNKDGQHSIGSETIGNVYGPVFNTTLSNRPARSIDRDAASSTITVTWVGLDPKCLGTEWHYTGADHQPQHFFAPANDTITVIANCDPGSPVSYRSLFIPEPQAIDTFYTDYKPL